MTRVKLKVEYVALTEMLQNHKS